MIEVKSAPLLRIFAYLFKQSEIFNAIIIISQKSIEEIVSV